MAIAGIILAAGKSTRMGRLKPLLKIEGHTFLWHIVQQLSIADLDKIYIVLGHRAEYIQSHCDVSDVKFLCNKKYSDGQFSSLQTGIRNLEGPTEAVVVCLADQPHVKARWISDIIAIYQSTKKAIILPKFNDRKGHPVLYASKVFAEIDKMRRSETAKQLLKKFQDDIATVDIADKGILIDVDFPDDLNKITGYFKS